jgi:hypothetical protein
MGCYENETEEWSRLRGEVELQKEALYVAEYISTTANCAV